MDRLLDSLSNAERRDIVEKLLEAQGPFSAAELRGLMGIPPDRRAHFGKQVRRLYEAGIIEEAGQDEYVLAEPEVLDRLLQMIAAAEAALDAKRAERSADAAKSRAARRVRGRTADAAAASDSSP